MKKEEKVKFFKRLAKNPEYAGEFRYTDPRNPGFGTRWTSRDLELYKSLGGTFNLGPTHSTHRHVGPTHSAHRQRSSKKRSPRIKKRSIKRSRQYK